MNALRTAEVVWRSSVVTLALLLLGACAQGSAEGTLVGKYAVKGALVENTCGQSALPTANPLDFVVEIREDQGVGYWAPSKASRNAGSVSANGSFRFVTSQTSVIGQSQNQRNLQPQDFVTLNPDFDVMPRSACALTMAQTVAGSVRRRISGAAVVNVGSSAGASSARVGEDDESSVFAGDDDLIAENTIEVSPSSGSDCNPALAALGGSFLALPCQARYVLRGSLDVTDAAGSGAGAGAGTGGESR